MDDDQRRQILIDVSEGRLTPAEAAERLGAAAEDPPPSADVRRIRVVADGREVRVVGDPTVATYVIQGTHRVRLEGDTAVVTSAGDERSEGFAFTSRGVGVFVRSAVDRRQRTLTLRVRPELALSVDVGGGVLVVSDVHGPISAEVAAGSATLSGFRGPLDIDVSAGRVVGSGVLAAGTSHVRCAAGSVKLTLEAGSDVRIRGQSQAGAVVLPRGAAPVGASSGRRGFHGAHEAVLGKGTATLEVDVAAGSVVVRADEA
jgi:hypothetical protein